MARTDDGQHTSIVAAKLNIALVKNTEARMEANTVLMTETSWMSRMDKSHTTIIILYNVPYIPYHLPQQNTVCAPIIIF